MKKGKAKILYVEDNPANLTLVKKLLIDAGYEVVTAEDGSQGIKMACKEYPDLILMDINLPGIDGYEATTKIKGMSKFENTPIVALTANVNPGDRERSLAAGCDGYLSKPINVRSFVSHIEKYLDGKKEKLKKSEESLYLKEYSQRLVDALEEKIEDLEKSNSELEALNNDLTVSKIALEDAYERLLQMDKIKSDFVANVSHELRTPLTSIKSYTEILFDEIEELHIDEQRRFLNIISSESDRLTRLVCDLLDLKKMETGDVSWKESDFDLAELLEESIRDFSPYSSAEGITITFQRARKKTKIHADRDKIKQVITNLFSNAVKFSPKEGGLVEVSLDNGNKSNNEKSKNGNVIVSVKDHGVGIDHDELDSVFDRFYQCKGTASVKKVCGTGLGLSICRDIIEYCGGKIWVDSSKGNGATFKFCLPVAG